MHVSFLVIIKFTSHILAMNDAKEAHIYRSEIVWDLLVDDQNTTMRTPLKQLGTYNNTFLHRKTYNTLFHSFYTCHWKELQATQRKEHTQKIFSIIDYGRG